MKNNTQKVLNNIVNLTNKNIKTQYYTVIVALILLFIGINLMNKTNSNTYEKNNNQTYGHILIGTSILVLVYNLLI